jgi:hypothetical protein
LYCTLPRLQWKVAPFHAFRRRTPRFCPNARPPCSTPVAHGEASCAKPCGLWHARRISNCSAGFHASALPPAGPHMYRTNLFFIRRQGTALSVPLSCRPALRLQPLRDVFRAAHALVSARRTDPKELPSTLSVPSANETCVLLPGRPDESVLLRSPRCQLWAQRRLVQSAPWALCRGILNGPPRQNAPGSSEPSVRLENNGPCAAALHASRR